MIASDLRNISAMLHERAAKEQALGWSEMLGLASVLECLAERADKIENLPVPEIRRLGSGLYLVKGGAA